MAGCRAGAGRHRRGRRGDRCDDVPDRAQPGLGTGVRGGHRDDPPDRHRRRSARAAVGFRCGAAGDDAGRHRRRNAARRCLNRPTGSPSRPRSPSRRPGCAGICPPTWSIGASVPSRPNPGAWTMIGDLRVKVGPVTVDRRGGERPLPPGVIRVERDGVLVGTASQPVLLGRDSAAGQEGDGGRRLGARRPSRRERRAPNEPTEPAQAPPQTARPGPPGRIRRAARGVRARRVRQPRAARAAARARDHRPRRRIRHRADLRHVPRHRPARRRHRQRGEPAGRSHRPGAARPAAARRLPTAAHPGRRRTPRWTPPSSRPPSNSIRRVRVSSTACSATSPKRDEASWVAELAPSADTDPVGHIAFAHAHPRWIAQAFADALGADAGQLGALLASDDERPQVHLAARPGALTADELAAGGATARPVATRRTRSTFTAATPVSSTPVRDGLGAGPGRRQPAGGAGR